MRRSVDRSMSRATSDRMNFPVGSVFSPCYSLGSRRSPSGGEDNMCTGFKCEVTGIRNVAFRHEWAGNSSCCAVHSGLLGIPWNTTLAYFFYNIAGLVFALGLPVYRLRYLQRTTVSMGNAPLNDTLLCVSCPCISAWTYLRWWREV